MSQKPQRWYAVEGDTVYIYDHWTPERSATISIVSKDQIEYYRNKFQLRKIDI